MDPKEAFRYLSHRFHGKGSGKRKTEKRSLREKREQVTISVGGACVECLGIGGVVVEIVIDL